MDGQNQRVDPSVCTTCICVMMDGGRDSSGGMCGLVIHWLWDVGVWRPPTNRPTLTSQPTDQLPKHKQHTKQPALHNRVAHAYPAMYLPTHRYLPVEPRRRALWTVSPKPPRCRRPPPALLYPVLPLSRLASSRRRALRIVPNPRALHCLVLVHVDWYLVEYMIPVSIK